MLCFGKDCIKKLDCKILGLHCESLREHAKNLIDFKNKRMLPLTNEKLKSHEDAKLCYIFGKKILKKAVSKYKLSKS